jgi:hypothetical protein
MNIMRTWIKIVEGDEKLGIEALRQIAIMTPMVCINDKILESIVDDYSDISTEWAIEYFKEFDDITEERCESLISNSGEVLGEYDFYFEWQVEPEMKHFRMLEQDIKRTLGGLKLKYELINK